MKKVVRILNPHSLAKLIHHRFVLSGWDAVYNNRTDGGKARLSLLSAVIVQAMVGGFSGGIFYTGLLVGYGINIVNISIITVIPYVASLFSLFTPYIMERFKKRKNILSVSRIAYYVVNILGITLLPQLVHSEAGRVTGLIVVVFLANAINFLFTSAYSPWHMYYITQDVRMNYFSSTTLVSNVSSSVVLILASLITDSLQGDAQLTLIIILRYVSFAVAMLDVYFLQKPKEPEYQISAERPSLLNIFKLPLSNKKFRLTMLIYALYTYIANMASSVSNTWLLENVKTSYLYINVLNAFYAVGIVVTSAFWSRFMRKNGTFKMLVFSLAAHAPTFIAYAFVNHSNYLWLMTLVRMSHFALGMALTFPVNNLIYVNLPKADQTNYLSFYTIIGNASVFLGMMTGTWVVAGMGENRLNVFGYQMSSVPVVLFIEGILLGLLALFVMLVQNKVRPDEEK